MKFVFSENSYHFVNLLTFSERSQNSDYCLSLTKALTIWIRWVCQFHKKTTLVLCLLAWFMSWTTFNNQENNLYTLFKLENFLKQTSQVSDQKKTYFGEPKKKYTNSLHITNFTKGPFVNYVSTFLTIFDKLSTPLYLVLKISKNCPFLTNPTTQICLRNLRAAFMLYIKMSFVSMISLELVGRSAF